MRVAAVILAGGRGERLGGIIKARLRVGGRTMLQRACAALAGAEPILLAHGHLEPRDLNAPPHLIPVRDLDAPYGGPLAGLAAAVDWALSSASPPEAFVLAPADTPFLPPDYVERLLAGLETAGAALACHNDQSYPTSSAWRIDAVVSLANALRAGTAPHSLKRLAAEIGSAEVHFAAHADGDPFANANTMTELLALQRRARADA